MHTMSDKRETYHMVVIEWDGTGSTTQWYRRMHKLAGRVRGEEGTQFMSALERRISQDMVEFETISGATETASRGVIIQEGCILCKSKSLADTLAVYARDEVGDKLVEAGKPRPIVMVGTAELSADFVANQRDTSTVRQIEKVLGKRGKRPEEAQHVVTCHEDLDVFVINEAKGHVINCPGCGGVKINTREGSPRKFYDDGGDIFDLWIRTRFFGAHWEPCSLTDNPDDPAAPARNVTDIGKGEEIVERIEASPTLLEDINHIAKVDGRDQALLVLDAIFIGRLSHDHGYRQEKRIAAITTYLQQGGNLTGIAMAETPTPDILDVVTLMDKRYAVAYMLRYVHNREETLGGGK